MSKKFPDVIENKKFSILKLRLLKNGANMLNSTEIIKELIQEDLDNKSEEELNRLSLNLDCNPSPQEELWNKLVVYCSEYSEKISEINYYEKLKNTIKGYLEEKISKKIASKNKKSLYYSTLNPTNNLQPVVISFNEKELMGRYLNVTIVPISNKIKLSDFTIKKDKKTYSGFLFQENLYPSEEHIKCAIEKKESKKSNRKLYKIETEGSIVYSFNYVKLKEKYNESPLVENTLINLSIITKTTDNIYIQLKTNNK